MTPDQVKELHQLSNHFSEGKATPAHIKKLSELIVLINSNNDDDDAYPHDTSRCEFQDA